MRFHMGVSFSWRTIKKYLIPFILGILAFFGFNFLNDNKIFNFGVLNTYALESDNGADVESDNSREINNYFFDDSEQIEHKPLFNKIYYFDDNTTKIGLLSNIYILLFLYCFSMIILRIITIIKNIRW